MRETRTARSSGGAPLPPVPGSVSRAGLLRERDRVGEGVASCAVMVADAASAM